MNTIHALLPQDEHNRKLALQVHPPNYKNPAPKETYNLAVIGAGTAGLVAAAGAAALGAKVALIERALLGGDCLNVGCIPSKSMVSAARAAAAVNSASQFGVRVPPGTTVDFAAAMNRMRKLRNDVSHHDSVQRLRNLGVDVFFGQAKFADENTICVAGKKIRFSKAVLCSGARASIPSIPGLEKTPHLTNETLFSLTELPKRLGIVGAGPIGCEMAQTFARFGSQVCLIGSKRGVLPKEDRKAAEIISASLAQDGVRILGHGRELKISQDRQGIHLKVENPQHGYHVVVDQLLVAAGRTPNIEGMNLEKAGVKYSKKGVHINHYLQTANPRIYAAGDVCSSHQFTHAADFMARAVLRNALFHGRIKHSKLIIPRCTYTSPEIAHVGLTVAEASAQDGNTFVQPFSSIDRAILEGQTNGMACVHVKKRSDHILGATIVAANAGDIISAFTMAITHNIGLSAIANTIFPYPTQAEAIRKLGDQYNRSKLTPRVKKLFRHWFAWTR